MLITPSLLHVKTRPVSGRQETATWLRPLGVSARFAVEGMEAETVLDRLDAPILPQGAETVEWQCIRDDHAAMADAGEWPDLLEVLCFADLDRTTVSGGQRVAALISQGARAKLTAAIDRGDLDLAGAEVARFDAVVASHPDNHAAVHLAAQSHADLGLARLALAYDSPYSRDLLPLCDAHFDRVETLLAGFDPIEQMSPLLAATRYQLAGGIEDGPGLCEDWFEDWCDLDPEDAAVHAAHARYMLPQMFGSEASFEAAARRAVEMTVQDTGRAAYAIFHMTARDRLGAMMPGLDLLLFLQGLTDYQTATGCQHRANIAASLLADMAAGFRQAGPDAAYQLAKTRAALADVLWNRLHEVHVDLWPHGADSLAFALSEVFGPALSRGARIVRKGDGLGTRVPRA